MAAAATAGSRAGVDRTEAYGHTIPWTRIVKVYTAARLAPGNVPTHRLG
jgi:hypothetical protein